MKRLFGFLSVFAVIVMAQVLTAQDGPTSVQAGVYTDAQAERGEKFFGEACMVCHQPEEFSDGGYMEGWSGQSVNDFVEFVRSTMPEDNPGRLKRREYIDIISYFFKLNGLPAGETDLEPKTLRGIQIEGPYGDASQDRD
jgi:cytochrome c